MGNTKNMADYANWKMEVDGYLFGILSLLTDDLPYYDFYHDFKLGIPSQDTALFVLNTVKACE